MNTTLPHNVERFVRDYIRQRKFVLFVRELSGWFTACVAWVILWCLADRIWQLSALLRAAVLVATLAGFGAWLVWIICHTLLKKNNLTRAALEIEALHPELGERLVTVCSQSASTNVSPQPAVQPSPAGEMLRTLADQMDDFVKEHPRLRIITARSVGGRFLCALSLLGMIAAVSRIDTIGLPRLLHRFATPWHKISPVSSTKLLIFAPEAGIELREREAYLLNALAFRPGEEGVILHYSSDGKTFSHRPMTDLGRGGFQSVIGPITGDGSFYLSSGDAQSELAPLRLLRRPSVIEFRTRYEYPAYMRRDPLIARNVDGLIEAPVGTKVALQIKASEKLQRAQLETPQGVIALTPTAEPAVWEARLNIAQDTTYSVNMVSDKGVQGVGPGTSQIRALADRAPLAQMLSPRDDLRVSPRDIATIAYQALDDFGVSRFVLRVQINNTQPIEIPLKPAGDPRKWEGEQELDMANLGLKIGDVVALSLAAWDGVGQQSTSNTRTLFISPHSVNAADYTRMSELLKAQQAAQEVRQDMQQAIASLQTAASNPSTQSLQSDSDRYQQDLADMGQIAQVLRQALLRALARSSDAQLNVALSAMADQAQICFIESQDLMEQLAQTQARKNIALTRLTQSLEQISLTADQLRTLAATEQASAALADWRNMQAADQARSAGKMTTRALELLDRMRQDVADQARLLGLKPDDPNLQSQLEALVKLGKDLAAKATEANLLQEAQIWSTQIMERRRQAPMLSLRLSAAADVESVRPDGDYQRASDLSLAARAAQTIYLGAQDPEGRPMANQARTEFVKALTVLLERHKTSSAPSRELASQLQRARQAMTRWAGESESAIGPATPDSSDDAPRELVMEANQQLYNRQYDRALEIQRGMMLDSQQAQKAQQELSQAKAADALAQAQDAICAELLAPGSEASALAQRQREVALKIEAQIGQTEIPGAPRDTRKDAVAGIQAVQERLAQLPQQLQESIQAADIQVQAYDLSVRLEYDAQTAPQDRKVIARRAADRARIAEDDARRQTQTSLKPIDADIADLMARTLEDFYPETLAAAQVLSQQLRPALTKVKDGATQLRIQDLLTGVKQTRQAIADAQVQLRNAQQALLDQDPLFAAKVYADAATAALGRRPPDIEGALANQQLASGALNRQWDQSVRSAAAVHLSSLGQFKSIYDQSQSPAFGGNENLAAARQWGFLKDRSGDDFTAASRDADANGYHKMLQVYFRALGKSKEQKK